MHEGCGDYQSTTKQKLTEIKCTINCTFKSKALGVINAKSNIGLFNHIHAAYH